MKIVVDDCVYAIIPARSGSKGIKNKNITDIQGYPLIAYSIATARLCGFVSRTIVSTDSIYYANIAKRFGAEVPFLRPQEISLDCSTDLEYLRFTLLKLLEMDGSVPEYILLLRPTTPLRQPLIIKKCYNHFKKYSNASAIVSVEKLNVCPYKWMKINDKKNLVSLFADMEPDDVNLPRQSFPLVYNPNGYVDILKSKNILEHNVVYGKSAIPFVITEPSIDIDTIEDLQLIRTSDIQSSILYQYLRTKFPT